MLESLKRMISSRKEEPKFDWYGMPMVQRAKLANQLGKDASIIMNKALAELLAKMSPRP